jgi:hypothetical protein
MLPCCPAALLPCCPAYVRYTGFLNNPGPGKGAYDHQGDYPRSGGDYPPAEGSYPREQTYGKGSDGGYEGNKDNYGPTYGSGHGSGYAKHEPWVYSKPHYGEGGVMRCRVTACMRHGLHEPWFA